MPFSHGKKSRFKITASSTSTIVDLSPFLTNVSLPGDADTAETTVFTSSDKTHLPGAKGNTMRLEGMWSSTLISTLYNIRGKIRHFWYQPSTATLYFKGDTIINSVEVTSPVAGAVTVTAAGQCTGAIPLAATTS